jgi:hypothetical protein
MTGADKLLHPKCTLNLCSRVRPGAGTRAIASSSLTVAREVVRAFHVAVILVGSVARAVKVTPAAPVAATAHRAKPRAS